MYKFLIVFLLSSVYIFADIFPLASDLGMTDTDYSFLTGLMGILCSYVFFQKVFR